MPAPSVCREILRLVWDRELPARDIAARFDVSWSAVSQNLAVLRKAGLLTERRDANRRYYRADREALGSLASVLEEMWSRESVASARRGRGGGMNEPRIVELRIRLEAPPADVFRYLTEPERYVRWQGVKAELDPRPGGVFRVWMDADTVARGEFVEVDPPRRVVFTWGWEGHDRVPPGSTTVELTLEEDGAATR